MAFELARLRIWRFGSSSESLDASTQAVLFDAIVADTRIEDEAQRAERERLVKQRDIQQQLLPHNWRPADAQSPRATAVVVEAT